MGGWGGVGQQMVRHAARDVGCHGWGGGRGRGGVGADKWVWEGVLFPKVPAGMTRRRRWWGGGGVDWLCECASMRALACVKGRAMLRAEVLIK